VAPVTVNSPELKLFVFRGLEDDEAGLVTYGLFESLDVDRRIVGGL
jgi:hypothetical protein